jgi:hypothetical protein
MLFRRLPLLTAAVLGAALLLTPSAPACPFCSAQGQTLSGEVNQADFIVYGTLTNPQRDPNDFTKGTTDLVIETVVKPHEYLAGKKTLRIPRYVPVDQQGSKFLVFCNVFNRPVDFAASAVASGAVLANFDAAQLDAYRGEPVAADSKLADYLKGAIEVRQKDPVARLKFFFDHLDSPDVVISSDAINEFGYAEYKDVRPLAEKLPADKVLKWLKDPNTLPSRFGLYGLFIGHCGKKEDAKVVRELLEQPDKAYSSGLDGLIAAYVMLDKQAGWEYLLGLLKDPGKEFPVRYAGLKVLRLFWEFRPDVVSKDEVVEGMKLLVAQPDMADLPIEDLRKWGCWQLTPFVLKFADEKSHNAIPIVRRSILRFALAAPADQAAAKAYVEKVRKEDPERVKFVEQTLKDEQPKPAGTDPTASDR